MGKLQFTKLLIVYQDVTTGRHTKPQMGKVVA